MKQNTSRPKLEQYAQELVAACVPNQERFAMNAIAWAIKHLNLELSFDLDDDTKYIMGWFDTILDVYRNRSKSGKTDYVCKPLTRLERVQRQCILQAMRVGDVFTCKEQATKKQLIAKVITSDPNKVQLYMNDGTFIDLTPFSDIEVDLVKNIITFN